jgi:hypothetical protein
MKRVVIRFQDGSVHSFDYREEKAREDLRRHLIQGILFSC